MRVAIEAANIRAGGGITHLVECLSALDAAEAGVKLVDVYTGPDAAARLPVRPWLKCHLIEGNSSWSRHFVHRRRLEREIVGQADILLVPGGSYLGDFRPFVTLAQNLLPFDTQELAREGWTGKGLRLRLLAWMQARTFRRANGVIYMTGISQAQIERRMRFTAARSKVVHHGTNPQFFRPQKAVQSQSTYTLTSPFRLLYLSILEPYKHQDVVVDAVGTLRQKGIPVSLDLVGPGSPADRHQITARLRHWDPREEFMKYRGALAYEKLVEAYNKADAFVFASSCETFGIILLEAMAGGLPIICSHRSAMPEVVGHAAIYFDPLNQDSLVSAIRRLWDDMGLRRTLAFQAQQRAAEFSWQKCARETFGFVREVHEDHLRRKGKA